MELIKEIDDKIRINTDTSIVFVHGIAATYNDWIRTIKSISNNQFYKMRYVYDDQVEHNYSGKYDCSIWTVSYYTLSIFKESFFGDLTEYAKRLAIMIDLIKKLTGRKKIIIIAHSMGGLVSKKYMTLAQDYWDSTYKILTVGTPNEGVKTSIGVVGQLIDLKDNSNFLIDLKNDWEKKYRNKKWGVIGAIDKYFIINHLIDKKDLTDLAGPGYIAISSSIPYGEWKEAINIMNKETYDTDHFGFRMAIYANHRQILNCTATNLGIKWTLE